MPIATLLGAFHYEFHMQIRRRGVWITLGLLGCLIVSLYSRLPQLNEFMHDLFTRHTTLYIAAYWTTLVNNILPLGVGVMLADRLQRDRKLKVDELFTTTASPLSMRLLGKYLGSMMATLVPLLLFYSLGVGYILYRTHDIMVIPLALETFTVITLPGILFISAFSLACPTIMWVPLYQFCFVGYWFWGNHLGTHSGIPTISDTILTPVGKYMAKGFYGIEQWDFNATPLQGLESMLLLIGIAIFVLFLLWFVLTLKQARQ